MPILILGCALLNSACAQTSHTKNLDYVTDEHAVEKATVLYNNTSQFIPLQNLEQIKVASVHFSYAYAQPFDSLLSKYTKVASFNGGDYGSGAKTLDNLSDDLKMYNTLIVELTDNDVSNQQILNFVANNHKLKNVLVAFFGNGKSLLKLNDWGMPLLLSEKTSPVSAMFAAQALFGGVAVTQKGTKTFSSRFAANTGFTTTKTRLQYTVPEDAGINSDNLKEIDKIAMEAIREHATPGCVVLVAKDGKVIFNKAYGYHTYTKDLPDKLTDIFDLASVTKISATTMEVMRLYEQGRLNLDSTVGSYIAIARKTNKSDIHVRELMLHQAGLTPFIPFYEHLKPGDYSVDSSAAFPTKVADNYYMRKDYFKEVMWPQMLNSALKTRGQYVYSDLSMYFMKEIVETVTSTPLNVYTQQNFYNPLGMQTAGFLPRNRFAKDQIIPTENDTYFRHVQLLGYVHDQGASMVGGVSGHAGLFASANDLAILYQMILNRGSYGGVQYFKPETVDMFTAKQSNVSRRGLGFDRWDPDLSKHYPSELASPQTYGHTGYTGTCFWVDPSCGLVYVFLSNRVFPTVTDKLSNLKIRGRIQDVAYEAIKKGM